MTRTFLTVQPKDFMLLGWLPSYAYRFGCADDDHGGDARLQEVLVVFQTLSHGQIPKQVGRFRVAVGHRLLPQVAPVSLYRVSPSSNHRICSDWSGSGVVVEPVAMATDPWQARWG